DLLVQLKPASLHRQVRSWSQATRDSYLGTLWRGAVRPLLPIHSQTSKLIDPNFAKRMNLRERRAIACAPSRFKLPSGRAHASMLSSAIGAVASCYYRDRVATEYRFPFLHLPLVEFLLAIP